MDQRPNRGEANMLRGNLLVGGILEAVDSFLYSHTHTTSSDGLTAVEVHRANAEVA
ncbi:hypothetical protein D3C84_1274770 [compost metagenome]